MRFRLRLQGMAHPIVYPHLSPAPFSCTTEALIENAHDRSGARVDPEFRVDALQVLIHRSRAHAKDGPDLGIALALGHPQQHLGFSRGEAPNPAEGLLGQHQSFGYPLLPALPTVSCESLSTQWENGGRSAPFARKRGLRFSLLFTNIWDKNNTHCYVYALLRSSNTLLFLFRFIPVL